MIRRPPRSTLFPYTDALPIFRAFEGRVHGRVARSSRPLPRGGRRHALPRRDRRARSTHAGEAAARAARSEEHTSELQSRLHLVCRLLLEKKKHKKQKHYELTL